MCGRYNVTDDPFLHGLMTALGIDSAQLPTRYNIAPTESVPVVYEYEGERKLDQMRWWLVPSWSDGPSQKYAMFNARSESIGKSRAFRTPFKRQRCIVPASSFIEWTKTPDGKQPHVIEGEDHALAFAGLWDYWRDDHKDMLSCTIVTTAASDSFKHIHNRMPVMLNKDHCELWLSGSTEDVQPLFEPVLPHALKISPANKKLGNARNKDAPELTGKAERIT